MAAAYTNKLQVGCHVPLTEEWVLSGHSTTQAWWMQEWLSHCLSEWCFKGFQFNRWFLTNFQEFISNCFFNLILCVIVCRTEVEMWSIFFRCIIFKVSDFYQKCFFPPLFQFVCLQKYNPEYYYGIMVLQKSCRLWKMCSTDFPQMLHFTGLFTT